MDVLKIDVSLEDEVAVLIHRYHMPKEVIEFITGLGYEGVVVENMVLDDSEDMEEYETEDTFISPEE